MPKPMSPDEREIILDRDPLRKIGELALYTALSGKTEQENNMPIRLITSTILTRLREPSSWGGIAVLLALFGLSHEEARVVTDLLTAAAATASVFLAEKGEDRDSP